MASKAEPQRALLSCSDNVQHDLDAAQRPRIMHLSFATDLLFDIESVRAHCSHGLTAQHQLVTMLKSRVALEKQYASELVRMAQQTQFDELERGTAREALGRLKAQYLNTSVQHRALAQNLEEDVLKPIEAVYAHNVQKAQHLIKLVHSLKKQAKAHADAYSKDFGTFEKQFREAATAFSAAMDAGFSSTVIEQQYHRQLMQVQTEEDPQWRDEQLSVIDGRAKQRGSSAALQSSFNNNSQKLVNWLLASDQQRKDNLCSAAAAAIEVTELSRRKCQRSWRAVEQSRVDMYRTLQSVMTEYQQIAEHRIAAIATNLRKHVVFESSALANEQYDWQMIAGKIESVDAESDIRDFILAHRLHDLPSMTVSDLISNPLAASIALSPTAKALRPLKRVPVEIGDVAVRKLPIDRDGNQTPLDEILVTRTRAPATNAVARGASPAASAGTESLRFDQLRVDCGATPLARVDGSPEVADSSDSNGLHLALAQDVALVIARANDLRTAPTKTQQVHRLATKSMAQLDHCPTEPENDGSEPAASNSSILKYSQSRDPALVQINDTTDDDVAKCTHQELSHAPRVSAAVQSDSAL